MKYPSRSTRSLYWINISPQTATPVIHQYTGTHPWSPSLPEARLFISSQQHTPSLLYYRNEPRQKALGSLRDKMQSEHHQGFYLTHGNLRQEEDCSLHSVWMRSPWRPHHVHISVSHQNVNEARFHLLAEAKIHSLMQKVGRRVHKLSGGLTVNKPPWRRRFQRRRQTEWESCTALRLSWEAEKAERPSAGLPACVQINTLPPAAAYESIHTGEKHVCRHWKRTQQTHPPDGITPTGKGKL